jgi:hypothetical protein
MNVGPELWVAASEMNADAMLNWISGRRLTEQDFRPFQRERQTKEPGNKLN